MFRLSSPHEQMSSTWPTPSNPATPCSLRPAWLAGHSADFAARAVLRSSKHVGRLCVHGFDSTVFWECGGMPSLAVECLDSCDMQCMTDCDWGRSSNLLAQQVLEFSSSCRYLPETPNVEIHERTHRILWAWSLAPCTLSPPLLGGQASKMESLV